MHGTVVQISKIHLFGMGMDNSNATWTLVASLCFIKSLSLSVCVTVNTLNDENSTGLEYMYVHNFEWKQ